MDYQKLKIKSYDSWDVFLHANQRYLGRLYLSAKRQDALDLMQMNSDEQEELFVAGRKARQALKELFSPNHMNYASFGNEYRHLHIHFIPRYASPRVFDGVEFVDGSWGRNYKPYADFFVPQRTLFKIRDSIKERI